MDTALRLNSMGAVYSQLSRSKSYEKSLKSLTRYEDVSDFQTISTCQDGLACHSMSVTGRACRARGIWRTTRQTDKRACKEDKKVASGRISRVSFRTNLFAVATGKLNEEVADKLRGCYEDITRKLLLWNLALTVHAVIYLVRADGGL